MIKISLKNHFPPDLHLLSAEELDSFKRVRVEKEVAAGWNRAAIESSKNAIVPIRICLTDDGLAGGSLRARFMRSQFGGFICELLDGGSGYTLPSIGKVSYSGVTSSQAEVIKEKLAAWMNVPIERVKAGGHVSSNSFYNLGDTSFSEEEGKLKVAVSAAYGTNDWVRFTFIITKPGLDDPNFNAVARHVKVIELVESFSSSDVKPLSVGRIVCTKWFGQSFGAAAWRDYTGVLSRSDSLGVTWLRSSDFESFQPEDDDGLPDGWSSGVLGPELRGYCVGSPAWSRGWIYRGTFSGEFGEDDFSLTVDEASAEFSWQTVSALVGDDELTSLGVPSAEKHVNVIVSEKKGKKMPKPDLYKVDSLAEFFRSGGTIDELSKQEFCPDPRKSWGSVIETGVDFGVYWPVLSVPSDGSYESILVDVDGSGGTIYFEGEVGEKGAKLTREEAVAAVASGATVTYGSGLSSQAKSSFLSAVSAVADDYSKVKREFGELDLDATRPWEWAEGQVHSLSLFARAPDRTPLCKLMHSAVLYGAAERRAYVLRDSGS